MTMSPIDLQKHLRGVDYPADKQTLIDTAERNGADDRVLEALRALAGDRFGSPADVSKALSKT